MDGSDTPARGSIFTIEVALLCRRKGGNMQVWRKAITDLLGELHSQRRLLLDLLASTAFTKKAALKIVESMKFSIDKIEKTLL